MLTIRLARDTDEKLIASLEERIFSDPWKSPFGGENSAYFVLLAYENDVPIAFLTATALPPEGELLRLGVLPQHRRGGVGRALTEAFFEECQRRGAEHLFLEVRASNRAARGLYESLGFLPCGTRARYYRAPVEDAALYQLDRRGSK